MNEKRDIIHKILDGEAGDAEKRLIAQGRESDRELREEFIGLESAVRMIEKSERLQAPPAFTAEVMRRLPVTKPSVPVRFREFLFQGRVLRWNAATALAMAVIVLAALVTVSRMNREGQTTNAPGPTGPAVTVHLTFFSPQAKRVAVAGDFNKWRTDANEMKRTDGTWSIDLILKPGVYAYNFVIDGTSWVLDPGAETYADDGFGSRNAVLRVTI